jgi:outer membrane protein OmpA-like peptidoglycan-associated protein
MAFALVTCAQAQFNRWAVGLETGTHHVGDQSALLTDNFNSFGAEVRYNFNPMTGLGLTGGYSNLTLEDLSGFTSETNYARLNAELFVDIFDLLSLQNNVVTILGHAGPGVSFIRNDRYDDNIANVSGGVQALFKLSRSFAAGLKYRTTANITQDRTLDGYQPIGNADINSTVSNFSVGLTFYPSKRDNDRQHADWYVTPEPIYQNTYITNTQVVREIIKEINNCNCDVLEYVFFEHDKADILQSELNAITKVYTYLKTNAEAKLEIKGYASATQSSNQYNYELSMRRTQAVVDKLKAMGADMSKVSQSSYGKDFNWGELSVHDAARRVELIITKQ